MENLKKSFQQEERSTTFEYGLKMLIRVVSAMHKQDSKTAEELTMLIRRRLEEESNAFPFYGCEKSSAVGRGTEVEPGGQERQAIL